MQTTKKIPNYISGDVENQTKRRIPYKIWQTFKTDTVPLGMYKAANSWISKNPDHQYNFQNDLECRKLIEKFDHDLLRCYERTPKGAFRADIWRYCALYQFGGIYADMDTVCKVPMKKMIRPEDQFIVSYDANRTKLFNAFMCASPRHIVLEEILKNIKDALLNDMTYELIKTNPSMLYDITGPGGLANAVSSTMGLPLGTEFSVQTYSTREGTIRVLRKIHKKPLWSRRVTVGFKTIILCKYPGYFDDLKSAGGSHWQAL